jgi:hypothetical protein
MRVWLAIVLLLSAALDITGNRWGTPDRWHPDELDGRAAAMVAQKTLNPQFFPYGGLHYYVLAVSAAMPVGVYDVLFDRKPEASATQALAAWRDRKNARVLILARTVSAVLATLLVLLTFEIGALLFGSETAIVGALFVAVAPYLTMIAHFATVDVGADFWYWLACLASLLAWKRSERPWLALACLLAGLAIGTKVDRAVVVIPLLLAWGLRGPGQPHAVRRLAACALLIPLGYVLANPTLVLSFFEFASGTARDLLFNSLRGQGGSSFLAMLSDMRTGLGAPLFFLSMAAFAFALYQAFRNRKRPEILWLLSAIVPLYLLFGSRFAQPWYSPFFYPGLALIAGYGCMQLRAALPRRARPAVTAGVLLIAGWSLVEGIAVDRQFLHDARYAASSWIAAHVRAGASIEVGRRGPPLSEERYVLYRRSSIPAAYYQDDLQTRQDLKRSALYREVQEQLLWLHGLVARLTGRPENSGDYHAWFDRVAGSAAAEAEPADATTAAPDYRVFVDYLDFSLIEQTERPDSGYRLVARIHYDQPASLELPFAFVNPTVYIFERRGIAAGS